ncbi:phosphoglycolate phosphatase [Pseudomonas savastanoi]|uniref:Phosphoglycolate phosphatase n=1 Tax=Pseudomonas savastanoi pv. glycinea TaxID=318 RepID=A0A3M6IXU7_PSESG|nr:phosphoglycolate phosphatase [Pseudomonas savastanoi]EFW82082.1 phosphoglycolate phosphatase [Pseudomonas savastanoi pv. glycinea str. B076]KPC27134.1 Phosphoglycolate phosphatase [Pseudomonas savastanoi pv. glycinea]KPC37280.1 Phosphoglycolate phosphatase [Pseudomonas savastanoi pv. glycinea]KPC44230.1 Phosphoglycolate phosphatase [Pseudomonas savastanoi pv. glycinea]KPC47067.1 Phosphoglycolate phosphatase [Pseudomonas savastanoi pv. glycinea]
MSGFEQLFAGKLPKLIMFDLDGTLVDSVPDLAVAVDTMLAELGRPIAGLESVRAWVGNGAPVLVRRALANHLDHSGVDDELAEQGLEIFMRAYAQTHEFTVVYPGVRETLKWLQKMGVEMALITNKPERFVAPLLDEMKLGRFFRWIIGGDTMPQKKPDPAALFFVMKMAGVPASQALFIGDSRSDVQAAKAAGVACVALSYGYNHGRPIAEENPAMVIDDLRKLIPGCLDMDAEILLPDIKRPSSRESIVVVTRKLWMKVIKALARWRWRA